MSEKTIAEKLTDIANNIPIIRQKAYAEGYNNGISSADAYETGYEQGVEAGKQAEYDRFWDSFQQNGNRTDYNYAFYGAQWTNELFKPKYPIIMVGGTQQMFAEAKGLIDFDFVKEGIEMDSSGATSLTYMFRGCSGIKRVGVIDGTGCKDLNRLFYYSGIVTVDKLIVKDTTAYDNTFADANYLENITIEGVIGKNGFNVSNCKNLTHESLMSIINALKSGVSGLTCTLGSTNLAKLTDAEKAIATQKGWTLA